MTSLRRPPADITPEQFFSEWLPAEMQRLGGGAGLPDMVVRVELSGEGGGAWDLRTVGGQLEVRPAMAGAEPLVTLALSVPDWRAVAGGEQGPVSLTPSQASVTDLLFVDHASRQLLATLSGVFRFEVRNYNGRTWSLTVAIGRGAPPPESPADAVIATDAATYSAILGRQMNAMEAYVQQKITITGDIARGMQVGLAILPKV